MLRSPAFHPSGGFQFVEVDRSLLIVGNRSSIINLIGHSTMTYQPVVGLRRKDIVVAYTLLRIVFGINFFNHGFTRIGNIGGFANSMVEMFKDSFMPAELVRITGAIVPPAELIIGILLLLGLATRGALVAGFGLMMILQYGVTLLQNWDTATSQLIYCLIFFLLLAMAGFNTFSLDRLIQRQRGTVDPEKDDTTSVLGSIKQRFRLRKWLNSSLALKR